MGGRCDLIWGGNKGKQSNIHLIQIRLYFLVQIRFIFFPPVCAFMKLYTQVLLTHLHLSVLLNHSTRFCLHAVHHVCYSIGNNT